MFEKYHGTAALLDLLAGWLPQQRWFPGRGTALAELSLVSDVSLLAGDPALRHLIVQTSLRGSAARFQVLIGARTDLPQALTGALIGHVNGVAYYDALHDPELADVLMRGIMEQRAGSALRFIREPTAAAFGGGELTGRVLGAEQSNTSLVFSELAILKVLRRLFPGANPDLEVADALARLGSARVAAPYGWIETDVDGEPVLLAVLSQYLAGATDGWTLALAELASEHQAGSSHGQRHLAGSATVGADFAAEARLLGRATAELHADMAAAFGSRDITRAELTGLAAAMTSKLTEAIALVPELRPHEARLCAAYDAVTQLAGPVSIQRIHGDYHLGQVLRSTQGWVALDFEGEPAVPLAQRRAPAPALRDVAGMLRSFDYAARHQLIGRPAGGQVDALAAAWVQRCQAAFCAGYAAAGGTDPNDHSTLLRALTLEKAVYEVVYEYRHRPSWLSIPLEFVAAA